MSFSFPVLSLLCLPLAFPAFYLAYKLASKRSLGSIFNQNIFFLFIVTGEGETFTESIHHLLLKFSRILHCLL